MRIPVAVAVLVWLTLLSWYDLKRRRLPNALTLPGAGAIVLTATLSGHGAQALAGASALTAVYLLVHLAAPHGMGGGDVKLAIGVGGLAGCFGVEVWFLAAVAAPLLTCAVAVMRGVRTAAHGPSMCVATAAAIVVALFGLR